MTDDTGYILEDLLTSESFKAWVNGTADEQAVQHWEQLKAANSDLVMQAAGLVKTLSRPVNISNNSSKRLTWEAIDAALVAKETPVRHFRLWKLAAAASALLVIAGAAWLWLRNPSLSGVMQQQTTIAAQRKQLVLPDSSMVMLGANSTLSYGKWQNGQPREVWLRGEAYFNIQHLNNDTSNVKPHQRFLVHINNEITVEVLGTSFLVRNRRGKTAVFLETGSIRVNMVGASEQLLMKPGETAELNPQQHLASVHTNKDNIADRWRSGNLMLNNTAVRDILSLLEDNYGKKIRVITPELLDKRVDGILPLNDEHQALMALSSILDADFWEELPGTIMLRKR